MKPVSYSGCLAVWMFPKGLCQGCGGTETPVREMSPHMPRNSQFHWPCHPLSRSDPLPQQAVQATAGMCAERTCEAGAGLSAGARRIHASPQGQCMSSVFLRPWRLKTNGNVPGEALLTGLQLVLRREISMFETKHYTRREV